MNAIEVTNLTKQFKNCTALKGVTLQIAQGELFGLLGVNGAGKTTLIRILSTLILPTSGTACVLGHNVVTDSATVKALTDLSPQETSVAPNLTVRENLTFFANVYGLDKATAKERIAEISDQFHLDEVIERRAKTLSGGWQRRLSLAIALISEPQVLFLDEPTLGLDVLSRRELWKIIRSLKGKTTIVLTSHYLEEIEALCDRVSVMAKGKILTTGTVSELKEATGTDNFEDAFVAIAEGAADNE